MSSLTVFVEKRDDTDGLLVPLRLEAETGPSLEFGLTTGQSQSFEIPAGRYRPVAQMPNGEHLDQLLPGNVLRSERSDEAEPLPYLELTDETVVSLTIDPRYKSPHEFLNFAFGSRASVQEALRIERPLEFDVGIRNWRCTGDQWVAEVPRVEWNSGGDTPGVVAKVHFDPWDEPLMLEVATEGRPPRIAAVPVSQMGADVLLFQRERAEASNDPLRIGAFPRNGVAESLLNFLQDGRYDAIRATETEAAERLFRAKHVDSIGATVGAYALARVGQLPRYADWLLNLAADFPAWADPWVLLARLAYAGEPKADDLLARLRNRGATLDLDARPSAFLDEAGRHCVPLFAEGLRLVSDRLCDPRWPSSASKDRLGQYAEATDWSSRTTVFYGTHPEEPDPEPDPVRSLAPYTRRFG